MRNVFVLIVAIVLFSCCSSPREGQQENKAAVYLDVPYAQDYSIMYAVEDKSLQLKKVAADRNGNVQVLSNKGLLKPYGGKLLYPGKLVKETYYRPLADKKIQGLSSLQKQFVYLDDKAVLSNAWAGEVYIPHTLKNATILAGDTNFGFLISDGRSLQYVRDSEVVWDDLAGDNVLDIRYDTLRNQFWVLGAHGIFVFTPGDQKMKKVYDGEGLTCLTVTAQGKHLVIGTTQGYQLLDADTYESGALKQKLPWTEITSVEEIKGKLWFGSTRGAFMLKEDSTFNYYASRRWLPGNNVLSITEGEDNTVWILTDAGLAKLCFENITLYDKAMYYEAQVRQRHIRYGFNCDMAYMDNSGDVSTVQTGGRDSDNLWTSMYLGSQLFRYLVTKDETAKQNCIEAFEAMERLHTLAPIPGLFGRTFERHGIAEFKEEYRENIEDYWYPGYARTPSSWLAADREWDWRGSASSDQTVGQYFALTLVAEYMDDAAIRTRAINLIDRLTSYILENDLKLVDYDGRPSLWGRWDPTYVNRFPEMIGDRRLCSSNIISFLQTAYHFTKKDKYREKALELLHKEGYLKNLTRPIREIGHAPADADNWSKMLSDGWNNSDDEMYFLGYWGLYPYALNDTLKQQYKEAIRDHWQFERSEKDGLWNLCYAMTGAADFDLHETTWYLREFPLDMIEWTQQNSHRKDIEKVPSNFRGETTKQILPPDERPELKHNRNLFTLDKESNGKAELGAGDTFLLPYWMGRFLGVISAPQQEPVKIGQQGITL